MRIFSRFTFARLNPRGMELHLKALRVFSEVETVMRELPDCKEKSYAFTRLEEASMWFQKAIGRSVGFCEDE